MRIAVIGVFASFGLVVATWAVHLPTMKQVTGMDMSEQGTVVLVLGIGALGGMQISGWLVDRFGAGPIAIVGGSAMAVGVNFPLSATTMTNAAIGTFVCGVATGVTDVAMNAAAVDTERFYGRPIMASFHAVFSVGSVVGAFIGSAGFAAKVSVFSTVFGVTVLTLIVLAGSATVLLRGQPRATPQETLDTMPYPAPKELCDRPRQVLYLGILAFLLMLAEGSAMDWSSLHAEQHLGVSKSSGAVAYGAYMSAMTIGRFTVDRLVRRVGSVLVLRWGCALAAVGLITVIGSPWISLTLVGWAALGLGLSGGVPQVFTAAGNVDEEHEGRALSRVVGLGYVAVLGGPALIGWGAQQLTLNTVLVLPVCAVLVCGCMAGVLAEHKPAPVVPRRTVKR